MKPRRICPGWSTTPPAEIVIAKAGKPVARLIPMAERRAPKFGTMKDRIWVADDWDSPETNEAIWAAFWENIEREP